MKSVFIEAVGIAAPGFASWTEARQVLAGHVQYNDVPLPPHQPALLPPNERRRATPAVRLAFQAAEDAMKMTQRPPADLATVFASSDADLNIIHRISTALTITPRLVSPTDFHNSVHNAAAGYWSIAVGSRAPSSTLSAYDSSFAAGLLEACLLTQIDGHDTLLVAFDLPPPEPMLAKRPIGCPAAVALVLTHERQPNSLAEIRCAATTQSESALTDPALEALRLRNPATRALPLLEHLAAQRSGRIVLPSARDNLAVELSLV
ncbi:hypothetical protein HNQ60_002259 [Povalibacter uvarum]|uniref:Beta-ketoacyl synthase-like N-terminal domain-containing protein n=1 Tax=Povalibacter uvarum TaxID=732238 RepID=A0A841HJJ3_9GAMM|nr:beta-ketoacyl synthase chain length factor [Povalibacter uvarum]MBB6093381.1 hypothetical protein [Povalibacter uvarum]